MKLTLTDEQEVTLMDSLVAGEEITIGGKKLDICKLKVIYYEKSLSPKHNLTIKPIRLIATKCHHLTEALKR